MKNQELSQIFGRIADILEFQGALVFKVNAYRRAARALDELGEDIEQVSRDGRLREVPGIGSAIAAKIGEYLATGRMAKYDEVQQQVPAALIDLLRVQGLGPKTLALLHRELGVKDLASLQRALASGKATTLPGMGEKKAGNLVNGIAQLQQGSGRMLLGLALPVAREIVDHLRSALRAKLIAPAGSLRRMKETVGDIDILVCHRDGRKVVDVFTGLPRAARVLARGDTKGSIVTREGLQIDLRVVEQNSWGAALQYFTGSKDHNVRLRELARARGMTINEYGIFRVKGNNYLGGKTEDEIYATLGLPLFPPELREDRGEIQASRGKKLPRLVELRDIKGDLHCHSDWSDGSSSIEQMAQAAIARGYRYIAICDHSASASYAGGLKPARLRQQMAAIDKLNARFKNSKFQILKGSEVDIRTDGTLDFPDELLEKLDIAVASVHSGFSKDVTKRMIAACRNPHVTIIAHPTGRLIGRREGYQGLDLEAVMLEAARTGTALEVNSFMDRLDLNDVHCRRARELGCRLAIDTDSHGTEHLWMMELGVGTARRGW
ncbi:MAG TPA: DNA polymerase/3'-5' exonuclease PolX, partial [Candidatus Edwardsbacteria bacterium]|nr:DNA polymerase/3'-5' exonuclease PolX [Candidatus Edwardsbacteria bacterium]